MRFVLGYYTEHLNVLEQQLAREVENNRTKFESAKRMRAFLAERDMALPSKWAPGWRNWKASKTAARKN